MNRVHQLKQVNWFSILLFYSLILIGTFLIRKLPNFFQLIFGGLVDFQLPWNMNHGLIILIVSLVFYKLSKVKKDVSLLGKEKYSTLIFPLILIVGYAMYGIENNYGINKHVWASIFISITLLYDIAEEYTWRGYLNDSLGNTFWIIKSIITGIFWSVWHLFIFNDFGQFGGFGIFMLLCVIFSFVLTYSTIRTKSIIVPATIHALMAKTNLSTLIIFIIILVLLIVWNKIFHKKINW
ncbi:CPBP family intramembrane glutamic endopeptidase [Empedobacter brevis]|uniref:CPBP family intramembrane glutamic endopeptidase n=1 Tax=Empedobacter brevis TaxID=247 RepID=UPI0023F0F94D|nr:CPBP family intramembrane glutamic endopeptidase [Empedobacter brevis]